VRRIHCEVPMDAWAMGEVVTLPPEASHYASRVLRLQSGATVELFNRSGIAWTGELTVAEGSITVRLEQRLKGDPAQADAIPVLLLMAHSRPRKLELVLQKSTELGVEAVWIVPAERAVSKPAADRLESRLERWEKIAAEAARQCGRRRAPEVRFHASLVDALRELPPWAVAKWACAVDADTHSLAGQMAGQEPPAGAVLAVGPEGGFTGGELEVLDGEGFARASLGPRVLRTETAPLVALTVIQSLWGDLG